MAQPEVIKDIDARVKKSGDTMTGNLQGKYFQGTWLQTTDITDLNSSSSKIAVISNDGWIYYRTPSELANDIGLTGNYVLKSGDTMTGNLKVPNLDIANNICGGFIYGETNSLNFRGGNPTTEKYTNLKIAEDGVYIDNQKIYYPGNKPTPADIGAATADHTHSNYAASSHNHTASNITSGTLGVARGGTGKSSVTSGNFLVGNGTSSLTEKTPAQVLSAIGAAASSHNHSATNITSGTLAVSRGGTGQTTLTPAVGKKGVRQIYAGTSDMTAGSTPLTTGVVYFVYE